jgi:hypothetical protein
MEAVRLSGVKLIILLLSLKVASNITVIYRHLIILVLGIGIA